MSLLPAVGRNAWERATTVLGAGFLRRVGSLQALKPLSTIGQFPFLRNSVAWVRNASGIFEQQAIDMPLVHFRAGENTPVAVFEPLSVNHIRNPIMQGAVVGTPGTLPNNWQSILGALSANVVGLPIVNGIQCIDIRIFGTSSSSNIQFRFEPNSQIVAANGEAWTNSMYLQYINSTLPPVSATQLIIEMTSVGLLVALGSQAAPISSSSLQSVSFTRTLSGGATVARVNTGLQFNLTNGASYDFTIRIGWPQMEPFNYQTSPMPSNGSAAFTRAVSQFPVNNLQAGGVFGATTGTIVLDIARMVANAAGTAPWVLRRADGTEVVRFEANGIANQYRVNLPTLGQTTAYNAGTKIAVAWDGTNVRIAHGGNIIGTFAGVLGAVDQLRYTGNGLLELRNQLTFATADTNAQLLSYIA